MAGSKPLVVATSHCDWPCDIWLISGSWGAIERIPRGIGINVRNQVLASPNKNLAANNRQVSCLPHAAASSLARSCVACQLWDPFTAP